jgi:hypothetical protein
MSAIKKGTGETDRKRARTGRENVAHPFSRFETVIDLYWLGQESPPRSRNDKERSPEFYWKILK